MQHKQTMSYMDATGVIEYNWPERSLSYACRSFDHLYRGQAYEEAHSVIHIGFLAFTLFKDAPEFYAEYKLTNTKNHRIYSDKFILRVVDLNQTELATEEDKAYHIDYWARLFQANTWEEIKMFANENEYLQEAAESLYVANADEIVRQQCQAREDAERRERTLDRALKTAQEELSNAQEELSNTQKELSNMKEENAKLDNVIAAKDFALAQKEARILELEAKLTQEKIVF